MARKFVLGLPAGHSAVFVSSRTAERSEAFAREMKIAAQSAGYPVPADVDCVYIASPAFQHEAHAIECLNAGMPVLVEKPFAISAASAARIVEAARRRGVFAMEAMWTRFLPVVKAAKSAIGEGRIGEVRSISGSLGFSHDAASNPLKFGSEHGAGALSYFGVYPLSIGSLFAGPWQSAVSRARLGTTGVDEDTAIIVTYANGIVGDYRASLRANLQNDMTIHGTRGSLRLASPLFRPPYHAIEAATPRSSGATGRFPHVREGQAAQSLGRAARLLRDMLPRGVSMAGQAGNGYGYQAQEVARALASGALESEAMPLEETVSIMRLMDVCREGWSA